MTPTNFVTQLEDMFYVDFEHIGVGWITIENVIGETLLFDFDFESDFRPIFNKQFKKHGQLFARWRAAELKNNFVSERVELVK